MSYSFQEIPLHPTAESISQVATDDNAQSIAFVNLSKDNEYEIHLSSNQGVSWINTSFPNLSNGLTGTNLQKINLTTYNSITYICASFSKRGFTDNSGNLSNGYGYLYIYESQNNTWNLVSGLNDLNAEFNSIQKKGSKFYVVNENYNVSSTYVETEKIYRTNYNAFNNAIYVIDLSSGMSNMSVNTITGSDAYNWNNYINSSIFVNNTSLVGLLSDNNTVVIHNFNNQTWNSISSPNNYGYPLSIVCTDSNLYLMYGIDNVSRYNFSTQIWNVCDIDNTENTSFLKSISSNNTGNGSDVVVVTTYDSLNNSYVYISNDNGASWSQNTVSSGYDSWSSSDIGTNNNYIFLGNYYYNPEANNSMLNVPKNARLYIGTC